MTFLKLKAMTDIDRSRKTEWQRERDRGWDRCEVWTRPKSLTLTAIWYFVSPLFCSGSNHQVIKPGRPVSVGLRVVPSGAKAARQMWRRDWALLCTSMVLWAFQCDCTKINGKMESWIKENSCLIYWHIFVWSFVWKYENTHVHTGMHTCIHTLQTVHAHTHNVSTNQAVT